MAELDNVLGSKRDISKSAHLKNGGQGSPNEVSFSVLDAKKIQNGEGTSRGGGISPLGRISLFTLGKHKPGVTPTKDKRITLSGDVQASNAASKRAGTYGAKGAHRAAAVGGSGVGASGPGVRQGSSWQMPEDALKSRKKKRKHAKQLVTCVVVLICGCLIFSAATFLTSQYQQKKDTESKLAALLSEVNVQVNSAKSYDDYIGSLLLQPFEADDVVENYDAAEIDGDFKNNLYAELSDSKASIELMQSSLTNSKDIEAANNALEVINAMEKQLDLGAEVVSLTHTSTAAYEKASDFLEYVLEGDAYSRDASTYSADLTDENASYSIQQSEQAKEKFTLALESLNELAEVDEAFSADNNEEIAAFSDYVNMRLQSQEYSILSMQAYLAKDKDALASNTDAFNNSETVAAQLMSERQKYPADLVKDHYQTEIDAKSELWGSESRILSAALAQVNAYAA